MDEAEETALLLLLFPLLLLLLLLLLPLPPLPVLPFSEDAVVLAPSVVDEDDALSPPPPPLSLEKVKISAPFLSGDFLVTAVTAVAAPEGGVPRRPQESLEPRRVSSGPAEVGVLHLKLEIDQNSVNGKSSKQ